MSNNSGDAALAVAVILFFVLGAIAVNLELSVMSMLKTGLGVLIVLGATVLVSRFHVVDFWTISPISATALWIAFLPALNYKACKDGPNNIFEAWGATQQKSSVFQTPSCYDISWYGEGIYQFLVALGILAAGYGLKAYLTRHNYRY